jgi:hypothetical protein
MVRCGEAEVETDFMIEASCDCGAVRMEVDEPPLWVTDCNCGICRRYGALWAYYPLAKVRVTGPTTVYQRRERALEFHHCSVCGCVMHWSPVDRSSDRMGVNARMMAPEVVAAASVDLCDAASW